MESPARDPAGRNGGVRPEDVAIIIPALDEAANLRELLPDLIAAGYGQVLVCDNGSSDDTREVVESSGATWVYEPQRGYGAACWAGMQHLSDAGSVIVFLDADLTHDHNRIADLVSPIQAGEQDMVIAARTQRDAGSMTFPQRFANWLFPFLIRAGWGHRFEDLGPFRAIRRESLGAIGMTDRAFGWTIEMQIRAVELNLRILEIPIRCRARRRGKSKISGTVKGVILAAYWIVRTCGSLYLTRGRRREGAEASPNSADRSVTERRRKALLRRGHARREERADSKSA